jgi:hypothetical protein
LAIGVPPGVTGASDANALASLNTAEPSSGLEVSVEVSRS